MADADEDKSCPHCGRLLHGSDGRCPRCDNGAPPPEPGQVRSVLEAQEAEHRVTSEALRLTPAQLEAAPRVALTGNAKGAWGRPSESNARASIPPPPPETPRAEHELPGEEDGEEENAPESQSDLRNATTPPPPEPEPEPDHEAHEEEEDEDETEGAPPDVSLRPPVLASDALRRELFPAQPGELAIRILVPLLGALGCAAAVVLLGWTPKSVPVLIAYAALAALGGIPLSYMGRAVALVAFSGLGLAATGLLRLEWIPGGARTYGLLAVVLVLGTGLHYRAYHRASRLSRVLVSLGICAGVTWMVGPGGLLQISVLDGDVRTWLPQVLEVPLGLLLMVSLLAFMDGRTTGGCDLWATLLWLWFGLYNLAEVLARNIDDPSWFDSLLAHPIPTLLAITTALLAPTLGLSASQALSGALAQGGVTAPGRGANPSEAASEAR